MAIKMKHAENAMITWLRIVLGRNGNLLNNVISYKRLRKSGIRVVAKPLGIFSGKVDNYEVVFYHFNLWLFVNFGLRITL